MTMNMLWDELTEEQKVACSAQRRDRLESRRTRETIEIDHIWSPGTTQEIHEPLLISIGRYADGRIGEVFIDGREEGKGKVAQRTSALRNDVAVLISIALQFGAPIDVLRDAVARAEVPVFDKMRVMPHTLIGSVLDALAAEAGR
jgi:hypothetical protein